jgi:hypothetical protein
MEKRIMGRRQFLELAYSAVVGSVCAACTFPTSDETHPTPVAVRSELPSTAVVLYDQPGQLIAKGQLELYQNTPPDWNHMPFIIYVDVDSFEKFSNQLSAEGVTGPSATRLVVHWPGSPGGAELLCSNNSSLIRLEFARAVYEHVYIPYFRGQDLNNPIIRKQFLAMVESQMNYVLYHEAEHIGHCRDGIEIDEAEKLAMEAESLRTRQFGKVVYIQLREGFDLNQAIQYIEALRNQN